MIQAAKANGIADSTLDAAQKSPVYRFVKTFGLALPLHAEYRTLPMLFYVPPLLPVEPEHFVACWVDPATGKERL